MKKNVGVLFPLASLPGKHGIGDFGEISIKFLQFLNKNHFHYWQVLPLNPIGPGHSPYMSTCSFALETRYISLDELYIDGLLKKPVKAHRENTSKISYEDVAQFKEKYLRIAYKNFQKIEKKEYRKFVRQNDWLVPYALFTIFKRINNDKPWNTWPAEHQNLRSIPDKYKDDADFEIFKQYIAFKQWNKIRRIAKSLKINIIADCPFYVGFDSMDCMLNKEQFLLDEKHNPTHVSGCPPDAFSDDGQLWGTPIYDFEKMGLDKFSFLINRINAYMKTCDILRLDHFRAFDTYYVIPISESTARNGEWKIGPRNSFFDELFLQNPNINLIAEDLGDLFPSVIELKNHYHLPGMFVVQFLIYQEQFKPDENTVVYPGTHDNQTLYGWLKSQNINDKKYLKKRFGNNKNIFDNFLKYIMDMPSYLTIIPLQDLFMLDDKARINTPGTTNDDNWAFKIKKSLLFK